MMHKMQRVHVSTYTVLFRLFCCLITLALYNGLETRHIIQCALYSSPWSHVSGYAFVFLRALHVLWHFVFILNLASSMASKKRKLRYEFSNCFYNRL